VLPFYRLVLPFYRLVLPFYRVVLPFYRAKPGADPEPASVAAAVPRRIRSLPKAGKHPRQRDYASIRS